METKGDVFQMSSSEAFSRGILKGLKPYATEENKEEIKKVTTSSEYKKLYPKEEKKDGKKSKIMKVIDKVLTQRLTNKTILKDKQVELKIPEYKAPSILNDPNRFFKSELEETKKSMFFE